MRDIERILQAFERASEALKKEPGEDVQPEDLSGINTSAYYLIVFAQFEAMVTERAEQVIDVGRLSEDARSRRVWQVVHDRNRQRILTMPFLDRLALILDKGSHLYQDVVTLYKQRNSIAHGSMLGQRLDVVALAQRLNRVADQITLESP